VRWDRASATGEVIATTPTTLVDQRTGEGVFDAHVELVAGATGDVLLASTRGPNVVSVFDVFPEGELRYRAAFDCGEWPRHFTVTADAGGTARLVVGAARAHEIRSFALADVLVLAPEQANGDIAELPFHAAHVVSPACICPVWRRDRGPSPQSARASAGTEAYRALGRSRAAPGGARTRP